jgi:HlyD family secretion protein
MKRKHQLLITLLAVILVGAPLAIYFMSKGSGYPQLLLAKAVRREIKLAVSTNGIIEPVDRSDIYAPIDGLVAEIPKQEGSDIGRGQLLMRLQSEQIRTALAEAKAALLGEKRQAQLVLTGPPKEEVAAADSAIAECETQLDQLNKDLKVEESLYAKGAMPRSAVESLQKQQATLQLRLNALKQKKRDMQLRYTPEDKEWEQARVSELEKQVRLLEQQLQMESVFALKSGLIYSLPVKQGSFVAKGQLLAQVYQPGRIQLRAYVDEPDLGRIKRGQQALIAWDGLANRQWTGIVEKPAKQVVPLNSRSVGFVICTIDGEPKELIPNLNIKVEIITDRKENALVVPRAAVFNHDGQPTVMLSEGTGTVLKPVVLGLVAAEEIEIVKGITEGSSVVLNHGEGNPGT